MQKGARTHTHRYSTILDFSFALKSQIVKTNNKRMKCLSSVSIVYRVRLFQTSPHIFTNILSLWRISMEHATEKWNVPPSPPGGPQKPTFSIWIWILRICVTFHLQIVVVCISSCIYCTNRLRWMNWPKSFVGKYGQKQFPPGKGGMDHVDHDAVAVLYVYWVTDDKAVTK